MLHPVEGVLKPGLRTSCQFETTSRHISGRGWLTVSSVHDHGGAFFILLLERLRVQE